VQQAQSLCPEVCAELSEACYVSARPIEACDQADLHRIGRICEDNRNCCRRRFCRQCGGWAADCRDERHSTTNQIGGECRQTINPIICATIFDRNVLTFDKAGFLQALPEGRQPANIIYFPRRAAEKPDDWHRGLLGARHERPGRRRTREAGDEIASPHGHALRRTTP
jgi:hypothetical protein